MTAEIASDYKARVEALKDAAPGMAMCITQHAISEIGDGSFEAVRRSLVLGFSHAWIIDSATDNIIVVRLPDSAEETTKMFKASLGDKK
jgi:hypothetical protein